MSLQLSEISEEGKQILQGHLNRLLDSRQYPKTICPSEVARAVQGDELSVVGAETWRDLMAPIRALAWCLRDDDVLEVLQGGEPIPDDLALDDIKGPIRLRKIVKG